MTQFRDIVKRLELNRDAWKQHGDHFGLISQADWTNGWQSSLIAEARALPATIERLENATAELLKATGVTLDSTEPERLSQLTSFCELLSKAHGIDLSFMFAPDATSRIESANKAINLLRELESAKAHLSVNYPGY